MSEAMELTPDALQTIGSYVKRNLSAWLQEVAPAPHTDPILLERIVRVEEELRAQRELMIARFDQVDRRFEQVDKRFEQVERHLNRWMTTMTLVLALVGVGVTLATLLTG